MPATFNSMGQTLIVDNFVLVLYQSLCGDYLVTDDPLPPVASARCDTDDPLLDGHQGDPDEGPPRTLTREGKLL